jgi:hypothetical protein
MVFHVELFHGKLAVRFTWNSLALPYLSRPSTCKDAETRRMSPEFRNRHAKGYRYSNLDQPKLNRGLHRRI